jgi:hypothetical protein
MTSAAVLLSWEIIRRETLRPACIPAQDPIGPTRIAPLGREIVIDIVPMEWSKASHTIPGSARPYCSVSDETNCSPSNGLEPASIAQGQPSMPQGLSIRNAKRCHLLIHKAESP